MPSLCAPTASTDTSSDTDDVRPYDASVVDLVDGEVHPLNDSSVLRDWWTADEDKIHRLINAFHAAQLRHNEIPLVSEFCSQTEMPKAVPVDDSGIVVMRPIRWSALHSILKDKPSRTSGLKKRFPDKNGTFFCGIVKVGNKVGCAVYKLQPAPKHRRKIKNNAEEKRTAYYKRLGSETITDDDKYINVNKIGYLAGGDKKRGKQKGKKNTRKTPKCKGVDIRAHRIICAVFNGAPANATMVVDHLGPTDYNHPALLRFCTQDYNE
jgi:hypothetical protein